MRELFELGMKYLPAEIIAPSGLVVNLGAGNSPIPGTMSLDYPGWDAEKDGLPFEDGEVDGIYAFHFLEHLSGANVIRLLSEVQRTLRVGGVATFGVPHRLGAMAFQDLDHKSFWTEDSWKTLFSNPYYEKNRERPWQLGVNFNMIMGRNERNLMLFTQLQKLPQGAAS